MGNSEKRYDKKQRTKCAVKYVQNVKKGRMNRMKKKFLSVVLAITMVSAPVYGAEFSDEENGEQVQETMQADLDDGSSEETDVLENDDSIHDSEDDTDEEIVEDISEDDISETTDENVLKEDNEEISIENIDEVETEAENINIENAAEGSAQKAKKVSKVEISELPAKTEFIFPFTEYDFENEEGLVDLYALTLKVTYQDGTTKKIFLDNKFTDEWGDEYEQDCRLREYEYENGLSIHGYTIKIDHKEDDYDPDRQMLRPGKYAISVIYNADKKVSCKYDNAISIKMTDCPTLVKDGEKYLTTVKGDDRDINFVKFTPEESGTYILSSREDDSTVGNPLENVFDDRMQEVNVEQRNGGSLCELEKGKTYYLRFNTYSYFDDSVTTISAEKAAEITSIKLLGDLKPEPLYEKVDISEKSNNGKWEVSYCWTGKVNIAYSDGYTETISMLDTNRYGQNFKCYISSKNKPTVGTYNVHVAFDGSKTEGIINNVPVKKETQMPIITRKGLKTVTQRSLQKSLYVQLKTGKSTRYKVNLKLPFEYEYLGGYKDMSITKGTKGISLNNGETCSLEPNTTYEITAYLGGLWRDVPSGTFTVTPIENIKLSKCTVKCGSIYAYTGKTIRPTVTVSDNKVALKKDRDYTVTYANNKNLGTGTVIIKGKGSYTGTVKKTFKIRLKKISITSAKKSGSTAVKLNWSKVSGATGYEVYKLTGKSWKKIATVKATSYTNTKLKKGVTYKYKIRSYQTVKGKKVYSDYSSVKSIKR